MDLEETTSRDSISMSFEAYLESELRAHEQISQRNLMALEEKVEMDLKCLNEILARGVYYFLNFATVFV